jgi:hypothetical protein
MLMFDVIKYIFYLCDFKTQLKLRSVCKKYNTIPITKIPFPYDMLLTDEIVAIYPYLEHINGFSSSALTNVSVKNLKYLKTIVVGYNITIDIIKELKNLRNLRSLSIKCTPQPIKGIDNYIIQCENLTGLSLNGNYRITDTAVKELHNLKRLVLRHNTEITDNSVMTLTKLRTLGVTSCFNITDVSVSKLTNLTELNAWKNINITDAAIRAIGCNLTALRAGYNHSITHNTLQYLTNLTYLDITGNTTVNNNTIKNMKKLTYLFYDETAITKWKYKE